MQRLRLQKSKACPGSRVTGVERGKGLGEEGQSLADRGETSGNKVMFSLLPFASYTIYPIILFIKHFLGTVLDARIDRKQIIQNKTKIARVPPSHPS